MKILISDDIFLKLECGDDEYRIKSNGKWVKEAIIQCYNCLHQIPGILYYCKMRKRNVVVM